jgi:methyl-accepting chemotaxis protein
VSDFDSTLGELHGTLAAIQSVLDAHPNIAREVAESAAQDEARANALARTLEATIGKVAPMKHATPVDPDTATKSPSA